MMVTVIIIAVLVIFTFTLILISYNLYASQNKNLSSRRNAEAANSFSTALEDELTDTAAVMNSSMWQYLRFNIAYKSSDPDDLWNDWPYYKGDNEKEAYRYFRLDKNTDIEGMPSEVIVCMYWELPAGKTADEVNASNIIEDGTSSRSGITLHVETTCTTGSQSYKIVDTYTLSVIKWSEEDNQLKSALNTVGQKTTIGHSIDKNEKWVWNHISRK